MEKKNNKISIIVPVYNGEKYISECIESILAQTYDNIELILIDDESKDNSKYILKEYALKDSRIKLICKKNSGVSDSRNVGIENSTGEYICFVDQDDYIDKDFLNYLYTLLINTGSEISLTPKPYRFDNKTKNQKPNDSTNDLIEIWSGEKATREMLYYNLVIAPWNKLIDKKLINKNNIRFNSELFGGEGFLFSIECFEHSNKVVVGQKHLYNYRVDNPNSGMTSFNPQVIYSSIKAQKFIKSNLIHKTTEILKACKYSNWHTYCDCFNTIVGCKKTKSYNKLYYEIKKVCRKDALSFFTTPISTKEKTKAMLYFISPLLAAKIINHFRIRKFSIEDETYE